MTIALGISLLALGAAGALAWGYRGQRDGALEQVQYLRKQLERSGTGTGVERFRGAS